MKLKVIPGFVPPNFRLKELKLIQGFVEKVRSMKLEVIQGFVPPSFQQRESSIQGTEVDSRLHTES